MLNDNFILLHFLPRFYPLIYSHVPISFATSELFVFIVRLKWRHAVQSLSLLNFDSSFSTAMTASNMFISACSLPVSAWEQVVVFTRTGGRSCSFCQWNCAGNLCSMYCVSDRINKLCFDWANEQQQSWRYERIEIFILVHIFDQIIWYLLKILPVEMLKSRTFS